mmetsp:Transcript_25658/g.82613  ORF Transcript_25658/g.82613 Transcript_25658/m.82613 type:complete len:211 (+) Transcript_25658:370-1002(+)
MAPTARCAARSRCRRWRCARSRSSTTARRSRRWWSPRRTAESRCEQGRRRPRQACPSRSSRRWRCRSKSRTPTSFDCTLRTSPTRAPFWSWSWPTRRTCSTGSRSARSRRTRRARPSSSWPTAWPRCTRRGCATGTSSSRMCSASATRTTARARDWCWPTLTRPASWASRSAPPRTWARACTCRPRCRSCSRPAAGLRRRAWARSCARTA